jgi:TPR repeat protein
MELKEIEELRKQSLLHDHDAQVKLGVYYASLPFSNGNMEKAEEFLRLAAEKHNKEGIDELVSLYTKYMKYYIENNKSIKRINDCFNLGVKWCKIGNDLGFNLDSKRALLVKIYEEANKENKKINMDHKLNRKFARIYIVCGVFICICIVLTIIGLVKYENKIIG